MVDWTLSVPSNIADGCGRDGEKELTRLVSIAAGSASELECSELEHQLLLTHDLEYLSRDASAALAERRGSSAEGRAHTVPSSSG